MESGKIRFALAQHKAIKGNIKENLNRHKQFCSKAAQLGADIITFPELSLTGYEPSLLNDLAIDMSSTHVHELSQFAVSNSIVVIAGCPIKSGQSKPYIGAIICHPSGEVDFYSKQYLHQGESEFCVAGSVNYFFNVNKIKIALAVCADFTEPRHQSDAFTEKAVVYLVSALISKEGFSQDSALLSRIAIKIRTPVLLSNFLGKTGDWDTAGKCSVWDKEGNAVVQGSPSEEGLTLCTIENDIIYDINFQPID
ncbi:carbon-nitrogen hydrolase family protein [Photobacterium damselae]|uniref:Predicted amidohydrolase n=2 Tax=Photobacterium damselae TaxID=38293 RepID=D0Z5G2_PHODD|nr:carbon-nitrogen hydrolase family protein [Photobacterium damselae]EEZ39014.1 predicted amidohydrolase [Photobacterium damselae subsp. damselae CIP 102761]PSW82024.1 carbon-nitrogen hydrolase family protein [Photobacterium damselae]SPY43723.1 NAD synthetase [Photobacterium damselae]